jgi:uncharacterized OB-fold protein
MILPLPDEATRPFWEGTRLHKLLLRHCLRCGLWLHPQVIECGCGGRKKPEWRESRGKGVILAHAEILYTPVPALRPMVPFTLLLVRTDEGPQLVSSLAGVGHNLRMRMRVQARYEEVSPDVTLVKFEPV